MTDSSSPTLPQAKINQSIQPEATGHRAALSCADQNSRTTIPRYYREYGFRRLYARELWRRLGYEFGRIAIYGAGRHTMWLLSVTSDITDSLIVSVILDDDQKQSELYGIPICSPRDLPADIRAVLISSDCLEQQLFERSRLLWPDHPQVLRFYEHLERGPYPWSFSDGPLLQNECYLVCDAYQFVYCPIQKVASTSLVKWFLRCCGVTESIKRLSAFSRARFSLTALDRPMPDEYYKFAFVRNPWCRLVSAYLTEFVNARFRKPRCDYETVWKTPLSYVSGLTFREFVQYLYETGDMNNPHWTPQCSFLGDVQFDFIGRFERLYDDFAQITHRIGIDSELDVLNKNSYVSTSNECAADIGAAERRNRTRFPNYASSYTPELVNMVGELYAEDISRFDYCFENSL